MNKLTEILNGIDFRIRSEVEYKYYTELNCSLDLADFKERVGKLIRDLGFSQYSYLSFRHANKNKLPLELNAVSVQLMQRYYSERLYEHDMTLQRAKQNVQPFFHSTIHDYIAGSPFGSDMTRAMKRILQLNKTFGYYDYYVTPVGSSDGCIYAALLVTEQGLSPVELKNAVSGSEPAISLLAGAVDYIAMKKFSSRFSESADDDASVLINPKPLRVLDALANSDSTINDVADQLSISVVTANQHLKTVRKAFGVKTNYAAIKKAILANVIEYESKKKFKPAMDA